MEDNIIDFQKEILKSALRDNRDTLIEYGNIIDNVSGWAKRYNMNRTTLSNRLYRDGSPIEKAILPKKEYMEYRKNLKKEEILDEETNYRFNFG